MLTHARDKETAAWLQNEFGGGKTSFTVPLRCGTVELSWTKAQRRIARMVKEDTFYTQEEHDNLDDVDPDDLRDRLAQAGIVNGEVADPAALSQNPFIQQVVADAENVTQAEDEPAQVFPFSVGDTVYLENGKRLLLRRSGFFHSAPRSNAALSDIPRRKHESFARLMSVTHSLGNQRQRQSPSPTRNAAEPVASTQQTKQSAYDIVVNSCTQNRTSSPRLSRGLKTSVFLTTNSASEDQRPSISKRCSIRRGTRLSRKPARYTGKQEVLAVSRWAAFLTLTMKPRRHGQLNIKSCNHC